jgi:CRP-like cAMP-binding protein
VIKILDPGDEVGDIFGDLPHRTSAWANKASDLLYIEKFEFNTFIKDFELRLYQNNTKFLRSIPCLFGLSNKRLRETIQHCTVISCNWNAKIIKECEPCKYIYIVNSGELKVTKICHEEKPLFTSKPGEIF